MYKKVIGTIISFCLVLQMPLMAYADEVITEKQDFSDGADHSVDADINVATENYDYAVNVSNNSSLTINGDVEANRAVNVDNGSVTINGDIYAPKNGVNVTNGSVVVNGSIQGIGSLNNVRENSDLTVNNGDIDGWVEIRENNSTLNVTAGNVYDQISFKGESNVGSSATVNGNVKAIYILGPEDIKSASFENLVNNLPEVTIYSENSDKGKGYYQADDEESKELRFKLSEELNKRINYIVRVSDSAAENVTISGYTTKSGYNTAVQGTELIVTPKVAVEDGYELVVTAGRWATVTKNEDGSFVITVASLGDLTIDATIREIIKAIESGAVSVNEGETAVVEIDDYRDPSQAPEGAIVVATGTTPDSGALLELAPIANVTDAVIPARAVSYQITNITPYQYINSVVENANATPAGETLRISVDRVSCFNLSQMRAFANNGIGVELIYNSNGLRKRIRIPAGFDLDSFAKTPDGFYRDYMGYDYLASVFGFSIID